METGAEIYELNRKLNATLLFGKEKIKDQIAKAEKNLGHARQELDKRLDTMKDIPVLSDIGD